MPNRLHSSSEVPDFSTYPEEPISEAPNLEATYRTYRRYSEPEGNRLLEPARRIGTRVGRAVAGVRERIAGIRGGSGTGEPTTRRVTRIAHERPMQLLLGVAAAGLAVGIGIRVWRNHA